MKNEGLENLKKLVSETYLVEDPYIVEIMLAGVMNHWIGTDPAWLIIVAPSGGAKSEFINAISRCAWGIPGEPIQSVHPLSTLTSKTFISGQKSGDGSETSLLNQINKGIITFKDFTSLLSEHKEERGVIMAQLREIFDGKYSKSFGTGQTVNWEGKITVIAGATYAIHSMKQAYTAMGERFLMYNVIQPDRIEAGRRTMENQDRGDMTERRKSVAEIYSKTLKDIFDNPPSIIPTITPDVRDATLLLAELATRARSDVERNWRSPQQEVTEVHPPEMPTRFAGQLQAFIKSFQLINFYETGKLELAPRHIQMINKLALDSVTKSRRIAMQELAKYDVIQTAGLATKLGMPTNTVRRWLEDLTALEIAEREKGTGNQGDRWKIKTNYRDIIRKFEGVKNEGEELTENNAEALEEAFQEAEEAEPEQISFDNQNYGLDQ